MLRSSLPKQSVPALDGERSVRLKEGKGSK